jgi:8-oxo-dGTP diphosphatase
VSDAVRVIRTVAAVIVNDDGRVLVVRKHGSTTFIQPGGKRAAGEDSLATLARELAEELGVTLIHDSARRLGEFQAGAVNEPGFTVSGEAFLVQVSGTPAAAAEIAQLAWIAIDPPADFPLAPLSRQHILPAARAMLGHA